MDTQELTILPFYDLKIYQYQDGYRFSQDIFHLANFITMDLLSNRKNGNFDKLTFVDIGTGSGVLPCLLVKKLKFKKIYAIEIQNRLYDLLVKNIDLNKINDLVKPINSDIRRKKGEIYKKTYNFVASNPPYFAAHAGIKNNSKEKTAARHEVYLTQKDLIRAAKRLTKTGGVFYLVYSVSRLVELFANLEKAGFEPKKIQFIHKKDNYNADLVLIKSVYGSGRELKVLPPIFVGDN